MFAHFIYNYKGFDGYRPQEVNVGDYIQSLAAMQYYPQGEEIEIDRDDLSGGGHSAT